MFQCEESDNHSDLSFSTSSSTSTVSTSTGLNDCANQRTPNRKRKIPSSKESTTKVMTMIGDKLQSLAKDSFDRFGTHVADRLRGTNTNQVKFAMKLISDVLFEADMTSLNRNSKIVSDDETQSHFSSSTGYFEWQQNLPQRFENNDWFRPEISHQQYSSQDSGQHQYYFPDMELFEVVAKSDDTLPPCATSFQSSSAETILWFL